VRGAEESTDSPLRHHHLKTANIPRKGDLYTGRIPMLFNQDMIAYRARPEKPTANSSITRTAAPTRSSSSSKAAAHSSPFSANCVIARKITSSFRAASPTGSFPTRLKRKII
jgi:hypothetical protein